MTTHQETRKLPYSADQMYDLVADVEKYPEFLPWCAAARVRDTHPGKAGGEVLEADLVISFKVFRERFASRVTLWEETRTIDTEYVDGPFKHMISQWSFSDRDDGPGCEVQFFVDFEFRNRMLQTAAGMFFNDAMQRIVRAFERRAAQLHG